MERIGVSGYFARIVGEGEKGENSVPVKSYSATAVDKPSITCYYIAVVSDTAYKSYKVAKEELNWKT